MYSCLLPKARFLFDFSPSGRRVNSISGVSIFSARLLHCVHP